MEKIDKQNIKQIHQIISYAPRYTSSLMRLLTQPEAFLTSEFQKEKAAKEAMYFLCASFTVAVARVLYGKFASLTDMESQLRWDSVITALFVVGLIALTIYILLHGVRSTLSQEQCLMCATYFIGAIFIFMAITYSLCMPLLTEVSGIVSHITTAELLSNTKFYMLEGQIIFMFAVIGCFLGFWPLYLLWGIGKAGSLGVARNLAFTMSMSVISAIMALIVAVSVHQASN
jgi:hypothetical protein